MAFKVLLWSLLVTSVLSRPSKLDGEGYGDGHPVGHEHFHEGHTSDDADCVEYATKAPFDCTGDDCPPIFEHGVVDEGIVEASQPEQDISLVIDVRAPEAPEAVVPEEIETASEAPELEALQTETPSLESGFVVNVRDSNFGVPLLPAQDLSLTIEEIDQSQVEELQPEIRAEIESVPEELTYVTEAVPEEIVELAVVPEEVIDVVPEEIVELALAPEVVVDAAVVPQEIVEFSVVPEEVIDIAVVPEEVVELAVVPEEVIEVVPEEIVELTVVPEEAIDIAFVPEQVVESAVVPEEAIDIVFVPEEVVELTVVPEEVVDSAVVPEEVVVESAQPIETLAIDIRGGLTGDQVVDTGLVIAEEPVLIPLEEEIATILEEVAFENEVDTPQDFNGYLPPF